MNPILKYVLSLILSMGVVGGGVWYLMDKKYDKQKEVMKTEISDLQKKYDELAGAAKDDTDKTADWKTYSNTSCKITMKYPDTWSYNVLPDGLVNYKNSEKTYQYTTGSLAPVTYRCETDTFGANIDTFLASMKLNKAEYKNGTAKIGGQTSHLIDATTPPSRQQFQVVFYGGKVHTFTNQAEDIAAAASNGGQADKTYINGIYAQILGSVVFGN